MRSTAPLTPGEQRCLLRLQQTHSSVKANFTPCTTIWAILCGEFYWDLTTTLPSGATQHGHGPKGRGVSLSTGMVTTPLRSKSQVADPSRPRLALYLLSFFLHTKVALAIVRTTCYLQFNDAVSKMSHASATSIRGKEYSG